jgi:hypothetical protein
VQVSTDLAPGFRNKKIGNVRLINYPVTMTRFNDEGVNRCLERASIGGSAHTKRKAKPKNEPFPSYRLSGITWHSPPFESQSVQMIFILHVQLFVLQPQTGLLRMGLLRGLCEKLSQGCSGQLFCYTSRLSDKAETSFSVVC